MTDKVLIVGGGVFGQVIAARLRKDGHKVLVYDRRETEAGSIPSGGHLKPSWLGHIPKVDLTRSLETLDSLYGIETLKCRFGTELVYKTVELLRVDMDSILAAPVIEADVTSVGNGWLTRDGERLQGTVIVAAGAWSAVLLPQAAWGLTAKKGISWVFEGGRRVPNLIRPWAPYKQIVRTTHGPGRTWIGDGSAIIPQNWTEEREQGIYKRVMRFAPAGYITMERRVGLRPYLENGFQKVGSMLWLATGGGKSGTAMAGVAANKLAEALK